MNTEAILELISDPDLLPQRRKHYGLFYGIVVDNLDPLKIGRLKVRTPHYVNVPESMVPWAAYSAPGGGGSDGVGFYFIPVIGSLVCVSFISGDPEFPVWLGAVAAAPEGVPETHVTKLDSGMPYGQPLELWDYTQLGVITTPSGHRFLLDDNKYKDPISGADVNARRISIESADKHFLRIVEAKNPSDPGSKAYIELGTARDTGEALRRIILDDDAEVIRIHAPNRADSGTHSFELDSSGDRIRALTGRGYELSLSDSGQFIELKTKRSDSEDGHRIRLSNTDKLLELRTHDGRFGLVSIDTAGGYMGLFSQSAAGGPMTNAANRKATIAILRGPYQTTSGAPAVVICAGDEVYGSNGLLCDPGADGVGGVGARPQQVVLYGAGTPTTGLPTVTDGIWLTSKSRGTDSSDGMIVIGKKNFTHTLTFAPAQNRIDLISAGDTGIQASGSISVSANTFTVDGRNSVVVRSGNTAAGITLDSREIIMKGTTIHDYFKHYHDVDLVVQPGGGSWVVYVAGIPLPVVELVPGIHVQTAIPKP